MQWMRCVAGARACLHIWPELEQLPEGGRLARRGGALLQHVQRALRGGHARELGHL